MPDTAPTLRETLETALEQNTPADPVETTEVVEAAPVEAPDTEPVKDSDRDEKGRFKAIEKDTTKPVTEPAPPPAPNETGTAPAEGTQTPPAATTPAAPIRPPASWKPGIREKFATLPTEIQQEVIRVDRETAKVLQENAKLREVGNPLADALRPYEQQIRATGQEPAAYIGNLMRTAHALTYGSEMQRAATIADLVAGLGLSPQTLGTALTARMQGQPMPQAQQQFQDPRVDKLLEEIETHKAARAESLQTEARAQLDQFATTHEFVDDVAADLQALLYGLAQSGTKSISSQDLEWAYNAACARNPEIAAILTSRKAAEEARVKAPTLQKAKLAASSVKGTPGAEVSGHDKRSLRETIEDAIAAQRT